MRVVGLAVLVVLLGCAPDATVLPADLLDADMDSAADVAVGIGTDGQAEVAADADADDADTQPDGQQDVVVDPCAGKNCDDSEPCTDDGCAGGVCKHLPNAATCTDGNVCTGTDACAAGTCLPGGVTNCDDANSCTDESCDPAVGCTHKPVPDGTSCGAAKACKSSICKAISVAAGPWLMAGHSANRQSRTTAIGPQTGTVKWSVAVGSYVGSPATDGKGAIYISSSGGGVGIKGGGLHALDKTGAQGWVEDVLYGAIAPAIDGSGIVFSTGSWNVSLVAKQPNGVTLWTLKGMGVGTEPAIGPDGTIYFGSWDKNVYAVSPAGVKKWSVTTGATIYLAVAVGSDGTIFAISSDKKLHAFSPIGNEKWSTAVGDSVQGWPVIADDGTVYVAGAEVSAFAADGSLKWTYSNVWSQTPPAVGADGSIYVGSLDGTLLALTPSGTKLWAVKPGAGITGAMAIGGDGTIYLTATDHRVYAIAGDGTQKWSFLVGADFYKNDVALDEDGTLYVGDATDGRLYAFADGAKTACQTTSDCQSPSSGGCWQVECMDGHCVPINAVEDANCALPASCALCKANACISTDCDDADPCTKDSCQAPTGCRNDYLPDGTPCGTNAICTGGMCQ